ncbi:MAG TPA: hypothetical protein VG819_14370 [Rhizomicrobium sp.]|jgi:hypothetical protein|nr:hypothetical protein [Rhizomicrobium sp.]
MGRLTARQAILLGGVVAGTIDIGAAALIAGRSPVVICRIIAGGVLGPAALDGGIASAALGLVLQWAMSVVIAALFVTASARFAILRRDWLFAGIAYGVPVYFVMEYAIVPLSAWHRMPAFDVFAFAQNMAAMMLFGAIVAFFASKAR